MPLLSLDLGQLFPYDSQLLLHCLNLLLLGLQPFLHFMQKIGLPRESQFLVMFCH